MSIETHLLRYESPLGPIGLELLGNVCHRLELGVARDKECSPDHPIALWLRAYFMGKHLALPAIVPAKSRFQEQLRHALLDIPAGQTRTYGELAKLLKSSPRAVGQALGANPLPIMIPCHRVVAVNGLGGFSGGEGWKEKLLRFEKAI
ncbi:methylated-DNA--[protein]-cysteine S-methyltransferase [Pseudomonadota bacterium]